MATYDNVGNIEGELSPEDILANVTSFPAYEAAAPAKYKSDKRNDKPNDKPDAADGDYDEGEGEDSASGDYDEGEGDGSTGDDIEVSKDSNSKENESVVKEVISKGNEISARELMSLYNNVLNSLALYLYEYKHGEDENGLRQQVATLREAIAKGRKQGMSNEEELDALRLVEKLQEVLDRYDERKKHLDAASRLTPENAKKAAELLAEILAINNVNINPMWVLAAILLTPVANSLIIIFFDKTRFKQFK